ncbi:amidohydrolase [Lentzea flaviverrucosa]|uniref:Hippurate hydrolase n=1 Tax=Lentzea flaviverrucosa TaxID=200379 RepID=A0A1H9XR36_9PSEU|nr:amidohydrolase [Lentzea flaviverrucosa]RDI19870.1 hippurate hydrolase [Lentzea flaviverrucosa]SES48614.1 hippurate hydrolase [Lentzea flaviverrucosa]
MPDLHALYRDLHEHPELSLQEFRTAGVLADALRPLGYEVTTEVGGTGVVGVLRNGDGPVVMLRADIDALPVHEATGLPYASTVRATSSDGEDVPVAHACGHDMHATCLIGAAERLVQTREEWSGTLLVVFQPAEELGSGARSMVEDGLFDRFGKPEVVLAQHVSPLPAGMIAYGSGPLMAASDSVRVTLFGRGGHGSAPETAIDPVLMAAHTVVRLQGIVAREVAPSERAVVTVGRLQAGTKENVIPETAEIGVNIRTFNEHVRGIVRAAVERIARAEAAASGAPREPEFDWYDGTPVLVSDPDATTRTMAAFAGHFGENNLIPGAVVNASEDVGVFGTAAGVPTVFWFLGGTDFSTREPGQPVAMNHSPEYAPDVEPTLTTGVDALVVAARTWLG